MKRLEAAHTEEEGEGFDQLYNIPSTLSQGFTRRGRSTGQQQHAFTMLPRNMADNKPFQSDLHRVKEL